MVPSTEFPGCLEHPKKDTLEEEVTAPFGTEDCYPGLCINELYSKYLYLGDGEGQAGG